MGMPVVARCLCSGTRFFAWLHKRPVRAWLDDRGHRYIVTDPTLLQGFKIALEHVEEMV